MGRWGKIVTISLLPRPEGGGRGEGSGLGALVTGWPKAPLKLRNMMVPIVRGPRRASFHPVGLSEINNPILCVQDQTDVPNSAIKLAVENFNHDAIDEG
jgi:hypothetical protein